MQSSYKQHVQTSRDFCSCQCLGGGVGGNKNIFTISLFILLTFSLGSQLFYSYPSLLELNLFSPNANREFTPLTLNRNINSHTIKYQNGTSITYTNYYNYNYTITNTNHVPSHPSPNLDEILHTLNVKLDIKKLDSKSTKILPVLMEGGSLRLFIYYTYGRNYYVEWGSGGSTQIAPLLINKRAFSIEHYIPWCHKMQKNEVIQIAMTLNKIQFECVNTHEELRNLGKPGHSADASKIGRMYVNRVDDIVEQLYKEDKSFDGILDVVLIDGRYRVACALKLFSNGYVINNRSIVMVHDFLKRQDEYKMINDYFDLIDPSTETINIAKKHGSMAVFMPKIATKELVTKSKIELEQLIMKGEYI